MTKKRKNVEENTQSNPFTKKSKVLDQKRSDEGPNGSQPKIDSTYGQRGAFPGLDNVTAEDDLFYGPADDGVAYLRMVRSEAKGVPNLLVAPTSPKDSQENLYADYPRGFYHDGAYTATSLHPNTSTQTLTGDKSGEDQDPQEAYYKALCARFSDLSSTLRTEEPPAQYTGATHPYFLIQGKNKIWRRSILKWAPEMQLLASLPQESIIKGLRQLGMILTRTKLKSKNGKYIGVWAWGLLVRCREVGQMSSEEVGVLRDLAKQAVWMLRRISAGEVADDAEDDEDKMSVYQEYGDDDDENAEGDARDGEAHLVSSPASPGNGSDPHEPPLPTRGPEDAENPNEDLGEARERLLSSLGMSDELSTPQASDSKAEVENSADGVEDVVDQTTIFATLDMIVTVVGEFYGQKDLLNGRLLWDEMPQEIDNAKVV